MCNTCLMAFILKQLNVFSSATINFSNSAGKLSTVKNKNKMTYCLLLDGWSAGAHLHSFAYSVVFI